MADLGDDWLVNRYDEFEDTAEVQATEAWTRDVDDEFSGQAEYDALFETVLARMNAGRWKPVPTSEYSLIREVCAELADLHKEAERDA